MHEGKQHLVLAVGSASGEGNNPELIALRLP